MIEPESTPRIEEVEAHGAAGRFEIQPLAAGYGVTLGNALRRVLLSSLEGAAVTSIQVANVYHEFSTITCGQGRRNPDRAEHEEDPAPFLCTHPVTSSWPSTEPAWSPLVISPSRPTSRS